MLNVHIHCSLHQPPSNAILAAPELSVLSRKVNKQLIPTPC